MPVLVVVLLGGFAVNGLWCLFLNLKNKTTGDYVKSGAPLAANLFFAGLAGAIWSSQFICFKTGEPGWAIVLHRLVGAVRKLHSVRHVAGHPAGRMEEDQRPHPVAPDAGAGLPRGVVGDFRLQRLSQDNARQRRDWQQISAIAMCPLVLLTLV